MVKPCANVKNCSGYDRAVGGLETGTCLAVTKEERYLLLNVIEGNGQITRCLMTRC